MPGFSALAKLKISTACGLRARAWMMACSLPPLPITRIFFMGFFLVTLKILMLSKNSRRMFFVGVLLKTCKNEFNFTCFSALSLFYIE